MCIIMRSLNIRQYSRSQLSTVDLIFGMLIRTNEMLMYEIWFRNLLRDLTLAEISWIPDGPKILFGYKFESACYMVFSPYKNFLVKLTPVNKNCLNSYYRLSSFSNLWFKYILVFQIIFEYLWLFLPSKQIALCADNRWVINGSVHFPSHIPCYIM